MYVRRGRQQFGIAKVRKGQRRRNMGTARTQGLRLNPMGSLQPLGSMRYPRRRRAAWRI